MAEFLMHVPDELLRDGRQSLVFEAGLKQGSAFARDVSGRMESGVSNR